MFTDGFFEFVTDLNDSRNLNRIINDSGRLFGNYVNVIVKKENIYSMFKKNRWYSYLNNVSDDVNYYVYRTHRKNPKKWNSVANYVNNYIKDNLKEEINIFLSRFNLIECDKARVTVEAVLIKYAMLKYFKLLDKDGCNLKLVKLYEIMKLGYMPCGWKGNLDVGGSLYVC